MGQPYPWGAEGPDAGGVYRANFPNIAPPEPRLYFIAPVGTFPANGYGLLTWPATSPNGARTAMCPCAPAAPLNPGTYASSRAAPGSPGPGPARRRPPVRAAPVCRRLYRLPGGASAPHTNFFHHLVPFYLAMIMYRWYRV